MTIGVLTANGASGAFGTNVSAPSFTSTAGSKIYVICGWFNKLSFADGDISDNKSNSYVLRANSTIGSGAVGVAVWECTGTTRGTSHVITATVGATAGANIGVIELSYTGTGLDFDGTTDASASDGTTPFAVTAAAALTTPAIAIGGWVLDTGGTGATTQPSGYTNIWDEDDGSNFLVSNCCYLNGATGTPSIEWANSDTVGSAGSKQLFVSVTETGAGGATATPSAVALTLTVPAVTPSAGQTAAPATVALTLSQPAVVAGVVTYATPDVVRLRLDVPPVTPNGVINIVKTDIGSTANVTSETTPTVTTTADAEVGSTIIVRIACNNSGASGAAPTVSITDNASTPNTYTQRASGNADPGAANAGVSEFIFTAPVTTALPSGSTITVTLGTATTAKAMVAEKWTGLNNSNLVAVAESAMTGTNPGTAPAASITPTAVGQLVYAHLATEGPAGDTFTGDSDTTDGSWAALTSLATADATATNNVRSNGQYKIVTGTSTQDWAATITSRDFAGDIIVFNAASQITHGRAYPATVTLTLTQPAVTAAGQEVAQPATVTLTLGQPAVTPAAGSTPTPDAVVLTLDVPAVTAASVSYAQPTTVTLVLTQPAVTPSAGSTVTPATVVLTLTQPAVTASSVSTLYPASVSGRKLLDQNGDVFLLYSMSSWAMAMNLTDAEITEALEGVAANGFTGVTVWMGGGYNIGAGWDRYVNANADNFWAGTPWASALGDAWSSVDHIVEECARLGLVASLSLCGGNGTTGARPDWEAATNTDMRNAGIAVATRYAAYDNIIWHTMLDSSHSPATTAGARVEAFWDGVNDTEGASRRPVRWMEVDNGATTDDQGWMGTTDFNCTINSIYDYTDDSVVNFEAGWAQTSAPTGDCEPRYVGNSITAQELRERNYAVFLEGGCAINFGHEDWWPFGATGLFSDGETWDTVQADTEVVETSYAWSLFETYLKATDWAPTSSFVTTGEGATDTKAAVGASARAALAYFPDSRTIVVDTTIIAGTGNVRLRWYDPTNGTYTSIAASEAQNASRSITHPGNTSNSAGSSDWVLVVDMVNATPTPATVALTLTVPAVTPSAGSTASPTTVALVLSQPAVTATGSTDATATPATVALTLTVPAVTPSAGATPTPTAVALVLTVPAATPQAGSTVTPAAVALVLSQPSVTPSAGSTVAPSTVTLTLDVPAVTTSAGATSTPTTVVLTLSQPAVTLSAGSTVTPDTVVLTLSQPAVSATGGGAGTAAPAPVALVVTIPAVTPSAGATTTPATASLSLSQPAVTPSAGSTTTPAAVALALSQPGVTPSAGSTPTPATVVLTLAVPAVSASGGSSGTDAAATPATVTLVLTQPAVTPSAGSTVSPATVALVLSVPAVSATIEGIAGRATITVTTSGTTITVTSPGASITVTPTSN